MPDTFIPLSEVVFEERPVYQNEDGTWRYRLRIPTFLTNYHNWWDWWERVRFKSMEDNLKKGDVLFDVGAEHGWISAIYAGFVGAENMCLFEPVKEVWPNIKATWEENSLCPPMYSCRALISDRISENPPPVFRSRSWPNEADTGVLLANTKYNHIDENGEYVPQTTIDNFVEVSSVKPTAITIDVEGAELFVIRGAEKTLRENRLLAWISIHPKALVERYQQTDRQVHEFMGHCGYNGKLIGEDHEEHWLWIPR